MPSSIMAAAHSAPRCQHIKFNGKNCGAPAIRGRRYCYFHTTAFEPTPECRLPKMIEDATSLQYALMQVVHGLVEKTYDHKTCGLLLYALQIAASNLKALAAEHEYSDPDEDEEYTFDDDEDSEVEDDGESPESDDGAAVRAPDSADSAEECGDGEPLAATLLRLLRNPECPVPSKENESPPVLVSEGA